MTAANSPPTNPAAAASATTHVRALVDRHFRLSLSPQQEREMRAHLGACSECRAHYQHHLLFASIDPAAPSAMERLGVGLGLRPRVPTAASTRWAVLAGLAMTATALFLIYASPRSGTDRNVALESGASPTGFPVPLGSAAGASGFSPRGGPSDAAALWLYRVGDRDRLHPLGAGDRIGADDELAFAYRNPAGKSHLMVFGVDETGHVYWYFPSWSDPASNPVAIAIETGAAVRNLPDAVRHKIPAGTLRVYAIFTDRVATVRQVEDRIGLMGDKRARLDLDPGDLEWSRALEVGAR